jgi:hypothetical protein
VTDNGVPPLSASNLVTVVVLPQPFDFILSAGSTNLFVGETNSVSIVLNSFLPLTNVTALLQAPQIRLTNLVLQSVSPEAQVAVLLPAGPDTYSLSLILDPARVTSSSRIVASLGFAAVPQPSSAIVRLAFSQPSGKRNDGLPVIKPEAAFGQVIIIGNEPVLQASISPSLVRNLVLYGFPGASYEIQSTTNVMNPGAWVNLMRVPLTNRFEVFNGLGINQPASFYRAYQFTTLQPILDPAGGNGLVFYGTPGAAYELDYATSLNFPIAWNLLERIPLANSFQFINTLNSSGSSRFYRGRLLNADPPVLELGPANQNRSLMMYGLAGTNYTLQYSTNLSGIPAWYPLLSYTFTNSFQSVTNLGNTNPAVFYRIKR